MSAKIAYHADFVLVPLVAVWLIWFQGAALDWAAAVPLGLLSWTLTEYLLHRFVLHHVPLIRSAHDRHHLNPTSYSDGALSSLTTLPILAGLIALTRWVMGGSFGAGFVLGYMAGYLAYGVVHEAYHHFNIRAGHWLYPARVRHSMHHSGLEANFGVSTTCWDRLFRTYVSHRFAWAPA